MVHAIIDKEGPPREGQTKRLSIGIDESTSFVCSRCSSHPKCSFCHQEKLHIDHTDNGRIYKGKNPVELPREEEKGEVEPMEVDGKGGKGIVEHPALLLFRCLRCKQAWHYEHRE